MTKTLELAQAMINGFKQKLEVFYNSQDLINILEEFISLKTDSNKELQAVLDEAEKNTYHNFEAGTYVNIVHLERIIKDRMK